LLGPLLNRSELCVRNGVVLYTQLRRHLLDYACAVRRLAASTLGRILRVLQSKCLRLVTDATWYLSNRHIHENLGVQLFADYITALTASFDSS
jgi:hypothetical protein